MNDDRPTAPVTSMWLARRVRASRANTTQDTENGIDASRRVAWARFYAELENSENLARQNAMLRDRLAVLIPALFDLLDAVLTKRNTDAFAEAYRIRRIVDEFLERDARGG